MIIRLDISTDDKIQWINTNHVTEVSIDHKNVVKMITVTGTIHWLTLAEAQPLLTWLEKVSD